MSIEKYKHPVLFYSLATIIPWAFWFAAGYISHITPYATHYLKLASVVAFIGLLGPMSVSCWLIRRDPDLRADVYSYRH